MKEKKTGFGLKTIVLVAVISVMAGIMFTARYDMTTQTIAQTFWKDANSSPQVTGPVPSNFVELAKKLPPAPLQGVSKAPPVPPGVKVSQDGLDVYYTEATLDMIKGGGPGDGHIASALDGFLNLVKDGDYIGVLAYYNPADTAVEGEFVEMRKALREITGAATQFGFGPRYLHSTGQLHKGGANNGVFIIFTHATENDVRIPRSAFSFSELELSQAFGDMEALDSKGRRVALFNMKDASAGPLKEAVRLIRKAAGKAGR